MCDEWYLLVVSTAALAAGRPLRGDCADRQGEGEERNNSLGKHVESMKLENELECRRRPEEEKLKSVENGRVV